MYSYIYMYVYYYIYNNEEVQNAVRVNTTIKNDCY